VWIAVGVIVIIVLLVLALFLTGVIPGFKKTSSTPGAPTYAVTFGETGLTSGTSWSVTLAGSMKSSTSSSIVFTESNGTFSYTIGAVTGYSSSPSSGSVTVSGSAQSVSIAFTSTAPGTYAVTFSERGLPSGTSWSVTFNSNTLSSTTTTIVFSGTNGTYSYSVVPVSGYSASPTSGSVMVNGADQTVSITFTKTIVASGPAYQVTFDQTGLPVNQSWYVDADLGGLSYTFFETPTYGPSDEFAIPDGTYYWEVASVNSSYIAAPDEGTLTMAGSAVTIHITFELLYTVTFSDVGLASSAPWQIGLNGSTNYDSGFYNITFSVPNGTYAFGAYAFGYTAAPATGSVTVNGANVVETITFTALAAYTVTFTETGLPTGDYWEVDLNSSVDFAYAPDTITFSFPNGVYNFTILVDVYYTATPATGTITVSSATVMQAVVFSAIPTYPVTFTETGLASGVTWSVDLNGTYNSTTAPGSIGFLVPTGVDTFYVYADGYAGLPTNASLTVPTHSVSQAIVFTAVPAVTTYQVTVTESGLPSFSTWYIYVESNWPVGSSDYYCANSTFIETSGSSGLTCLLPDGYYTWDAYTADADLTASPTLGGITVDGAAVSVTTTFVDSTNQPLVVFYEDAESVLGLGGLPNGTSWSVTYNGTTVTTDGLGPTFLGPNGTKVAWTITAPAGYVAIPSSGNTTWYANPYESYFGDDDAIVSVIFLAVDPPSAPFGPDPGAHAVLLFAPALAGSRAD
jgi:hypothetical protein